MIRTPTLFILGAGASQPYNFPLGFELRSIICKAQNPEWSAVQRVQRALGLARPDSISQMSRAFARSTTTSIDAWLTTNPDFGNIAKALIAWILCKREDPEFFYATEGENQLTDQWYAYLWNALYNGTKQAADLAKNQVKFVTFNYDRSLEYFLHESTKNTYYGISDAEAYAAWSKMSVMHIYGDLGAFPVDDGLAEDARHYSSRVESRDIQVAANRIRVIPDDRGFDEKLESVHEAFRWATHVYVLGFGYDPLNCERLGFGQLLQEMRDKQKSAPKIRSSALDLTTTEVSTAGRRLCGDHDRVFEHYDGRNVSTLRHFGLPE